MRLILIALAFACLGTAFLVFGNSEKMPESIQNILKSSHDSALQHIDTSSYYSKVLEAQNYCKINNFNLQFCILADMKRHSGLKRMFVFQFKDSSISHSFLVSHGCGNLPWGADLSKTKATFSNVPESHCSSLGKYKIGNRGVSQWGIRVKYLLHGLDKTNSNALKRFIVLHSWEAVSHKNTYPKGTPEGWGCPAVSNKSMQVLDSIMKASHKPVLFWQFSS